MNTILNREYNLDREYNREYNQVLRNGTGPVSRASCLQFGNGLRDILSSESREF